MPLNVGSVLAPSRQLAPQQMLNATLTILIWMMMAPRPRWGLYGLASVILLDFYPVVSLSQRIACLRFRMEVRSCIFVADVAADEVEQNALDYFELDGQAAAGGSRGRAGRQKRKLPTGLIPGSEAWGSWMAHRRWRQSRDDCDSQKSKVLSKLYTGLKDACDMIPIRKGDCAEPLRRPEGETWLHGNIWQPKIAIKTAFLEWQSRWSQFCGRRTQHRSDSPQINVGLI